MQRDATSDTALPVRRVFLDRLRGLAVIVMIEVHVVNALLSTSLRGSSAFRALDRANGLVAPTFLFCAGLALGIPRPTRGGSPIAAAARRALGLLAIGYLMHASHLPAALRGDRSALAQWLQADILQVIALSLFTAALVSRALGPRAGLALAALALVAFTAAPAVARLDASRAPVWLAPYLSTKVPSQFPLLPWVGYAFAGAAIAHVVEGGSTAARPVAYARAFAAVAVAAAVAGLAWSRLGRDGGGRSPGDALIDLAATATLAGLLAARDARPGEASRALVALDGALRTIGNHSLAIYVVHVAWVYGRHPASLRSLLGPTLSAPLCALTWAGVTLVMWGLAVRLHARRARRPAAT